jgi:hypothetical protein
MAIGIRLADHATPLYLQKLALTSPTSGGRSVGRVCSRTKATELLLVISQPLTEMSTSKLQTQPLVRDGAPHQETRNRQRENKNLVMGSIWEPDTKTD